MITRAVRKRQAEVVSDKSVNIKWGEQGAKIDANRKQEKLELVKSMKREPPVIQAVFELDEDDDIRNTVTDLIDRLLEEPTKDLEGLALYDELCCHV